MAKDRTIGQNLVLEYLLLRQDQKFMAILQSPKTKRPFLFLCSQNDCGADSVAFSPGLRPSDQLEGLTGLLWKPPSFPGCTSGSSLFLTGTWETSIL